LKNFLESLWVGWTELQSSPSLFRHYFPIGWHVAALM
jgi:hypothetical protein